MHGKNSEQLSKSTYIEIEFEDQKKNIALNRPGLCHFRLNLPQFDCMEGIPTPQRIIQFKNDVNHRLLGADDARIVVAEREVVKLFDVAVRSNCSFFFFLFLLPCPLSSTSGMHYSVINAV